MPKIQPDCTANEFAQFLGTLKPTCESPRWGGRIFIQQPPSPLSSTQVNQEDQYSFDNLLTIYQNIQAQTKEDPSQIESCRIKLQEMDNQPWNDPHPHLTRIKAASHTLFTYLTGTHINKEKLLQAQPTPAASSNKVRRMAKKIALAVPAFLLFLVLTPALLIPQLWTRALLPSTHEPIPEPTSADARVAARRQEFDLKRDDGPTLKAMLIKTKGEPLEKGATSTAPVAILFCQNGNMMQSPEMLTRANQYNELGFNVVLFNYRGVGGSEGTPVQGQDLIDDGKAIVQAVKMGNIKGLAAIVDADIVLDGTSIGGAVALAVGKEHPDMLVAANHTFSNWNAAAGSVVSHKTTPIIGIAAQWLATCSRRATSLNNTESLKSRGERSVTIIQTAGQDELLNQDVRLRPEQGHEGTEEEFLEDLTHNDMPPLRLNPDLLIHRQEPLRQKLLTKLQILMEKHAESWQQVLQLKFAHLKTLSSFDQVKHLPDLLETLRILEFAQKGKKCNLHDVNDLLTDLALLPHSKWDDCCNLEKCQALVDNIHQDDSNEAF